MPMASVRTLLVLLATAGRHACAGIVLSQALLAAAPASAQPVKPSKLCW